MYSRNSFGSYYISDSLIHKINPIIKIINLLMMIIVSLLAKSITTNGIMFFIVILMIIFSKVPLKYYFRIFWFFRYIYILLAFVYAYYNHSLEEYVILMLKVISIIEYLSILCYTTSSEENIYGIKSILSPFNFLLLPLTKIAISINNSIRYLPRKLEAQYKIYKASSSRGLDYYSNNIVGRFFRRLKFKKNAKKLIKNKKTELKLLQELRMYNVKKERTNYKKRSLSTIDFIFIIGYIAIILLYLKERGVL